ncbi:MAG TPA: hypothetical protein VFC51_15625 [Chloroflexota bacterium]|nr:hypothetical protein [Chloroflexota bacterium]
MLRVPAAIVLAGFVGIGAQLGLGGATSEHPLRLTTAWVNPAGSVLAIVGWLSVVGERSWAIGPIAAAGVVGTVCLQAVEMGGTGPIRSAAHVVNIGAGFAVAFAGYTLAARASAHVAPAIVFVLSAAITLVVLRDQPAVGRQACILALVSALATVELWWVLHASPVPPLVFSAVLVLGLYATSGLCHAILDEAPVHAYVEIGVVTLVSLGVVLIAGARA